MLESVTGLLVDYVFYDKKTLAKEKEWLDRVVDKNIQELEIGNGFYVAKILSQQSFSDKKIAYDNGIIKVFSDDPGFLVNSFITNWHSNIEMRSKSIQTSVLSFDLFPHKYWDFSLNGRLVQPIITANGLAQFILPVGENILTVNYANRPHMFFVYTFSLYILLIILILIRYLGIYLIKPNLKFL